MIRTFIKKANETSVLITHF